jgi:hypothetical protein
MGDKSGLLALKRHFKHVSIAMTDRYVGRDLELLDQPPASDHFKWKDPSALRVARTILLDLPRTSGPTRLHPAFGW